VLRIRSGPTPEAWPPGGRSLTKATARKFLNSLSDTFSSAKYDQFVAANQMADIYSRPTPERRTPTWFTPSECALILESERTYRQPVGDGAYQHTYPLVATWLLTGARKSEALGLRVDGLSLKHRTISIRPNQWRRLKTGGSERMVPLWPHLEKVLRAYLVQCEQGAGFDELLFPATRGGANELMIDNVRKSLDQISSRAGFEAGALRATSFSTHTRQHGSTRPSTALPSHFLDGTPRDGPQVHVHDLGCIRPHDHPTE